MSASQVPSPPSPPTHPSTFIQVSKHRETSKHDRLYAEKRGRKNLMFQPGRHEFIPSILIMCTYRLLLPSLLLRPSASIIVHCFPAENRSFSYYKFTPGLSELDLLHFVVFVALHRAYAITFLALGEKNYSDNTAYVYAHVCAHVFLFCVSIHFKSFHLPLATAACNRPSMKARQLAIRGGGGGCGMGDYARGLVSYTISIHVAGRIQSQCIRTALCLFVRARRVEHTQREGAGSWTVVQPKTRKDRVSTEAEKKIRQGSLRS